MWTAHRAAIAKRAGELLTLAAGERALTAGEVIALWRDDEAFRDFFIAMLAASDYEAFFWEMPPVESASLSRAFECAIIRSGALARLHADDAEFAQHLRGTDLVAAFDNLGGDARLIAPRKIVGVESYGHIAAFVRLAPREQQHALLRCMALEIEKRLAASRERFWVSTSGLGVPWVHVRLDKRPKYYQHQRYTMLIE
jgi:hypothetical protein